MLERRIVYSLIVAVCISVIAGVNMPAKADFMNVLNTISNTAHTINSVNSAGRGTMSTVEAAQRFQDRQQDRQDRKRAEKSYNESAEQEYYRTLQETQSLQSQYRFKNYNGNL